MPELPILRRDGTHAGTILLDDCDAHLLELKWHAQSAGYVCRRPRVDGRTVTIYLHRLITDAPAGMTVDHINGNKLDNRRSNLRVVTPQQNAQNVPSRGGVSRYRGVSYHRDRDYWYAQVRIGGKRHHVGNFPTEQEAADAAAEFRLRHLPFTNEARSVFPEADTDRRAA